MPYPYQGERKPTKANMLNAKATEVLAARGLLPELGEDGNLAVPEGQETSMLKSSTSDHCYNSDTESEVPG